MSAEGNIPEPEMCHFFSGCYFHV